MMKKLIFLCFTLSSLICFSNQKWVNPIVKQGRLGSPLVETSPFVFKDRLYILENNQRFWELPRGKPGDNFNEDEIRIRDIESSKVISIPLKNHGFGTVLVSNGTVYVFAGNYGIDKPWRQIQELTMVSSRDLKKWTKPITVYRTFGEEFIYNTAVCKDDTGFVLLVETNDNRWPAFTFKYYKSQNLTDWVEIEDGVYGKDKYVGGPALYFEGGFYYTLYLQNIGVGFETRITRSKDLKEWEDAPIERPFLTFDSTHKNIPLINPAISESNASDPELTYFKGQTIIYFTGSDQSTAGDLQWATYDGTPQELFECFFDRADNSDLVAPKHKGDWIPVLVAPNDSKMALMPQDNQDNCKPTKNQMNYQERQLGAFIHFGLATYTESDFMTVPEASIFNPRNIDAEQWVKTAISFGAKHIVLTAKHHNGFCLWPTKTTDYSVKNSPWKNGNGDVIAEFVAACRKHGVKPGIYLSGGDKHFGCMSTGDPLGERKVIGDVHAYFPVFLEQLRELLTAYGEIDIIWFDGAYDPFGWDVRDPISMRPNGTFYGDAIKAMINQLQPDAVVFGGTRPDIRWSGSEQGWAPYPLWNCVTNDNWKTSWVGPENLGWIAAEANIHTRDTWFWKSDSDATLKNETELFNAYLESIGRGSNLLVNMTPDTSGLIPLTEVNRLKSFGDLVKSKFKNPLYSVDYPEVMDGSIEIKLKDYAKIQYLELEEDLTYGQNVKGYQVEILRSNKWDLLTEGITIGRKRIQTFDQTNSDQLRIIFTDTSQPPRIRKISLY
ncbi:alpha-L-fucosidase [Bacteroidales bacterium 6E]|nr:alpha-L-fucosidase [Bacteroidales bacterium 6E]